MQTTVSRSTIKESNDIPEYTFPKYSTGFKGFLNYSYNLSCNSGGGNPVLGRMSAIAKVYKDARAPADRSFYDFLDFYKDKYNGEERIDEAVERMRMKLGVENVPTVKTDDPESIAAALCSITDEDLRNYVHKQISNTYTGLVVVEEQAIRTVAQELSKPYELTHEAEYETQGIDGYIGSEPVQVKPHTYDETVDGSYDHPIIVYEKIDDRIIFEMEQKV